MNAFKHIDWSATAQTTLIIGLTGLHWLAFSGGTALLVCADRLASAKAAVQLKRKAAPRRRRLLT